jgi:hypothetical protein
MSRTVVTLAAALLAATPAAHAQPKSPKQGEADKADKDNAKALLASGLKLFQAKDYLGALAVFKDAYARFPSPKILLNIATTLKQLARNAEAANTYQQYYDAPDADAAKKAEVAKVLAELDAKVAVLEITVKPADAEVEINGEGRLAPASALAKVRVEPGKVTIRARAEDYKPLLRNIEVKAGAREVVALEMTVEQVVLAPTAPRETDPGDDDTTQIDRGADGDGGITKRLGAYAVANIDVANKGGAARVAGTFEFIPRLQAELGGIIGPSPGMYVGARYAILPGRFRPLVAAGAPIFFKDGARVALRGAAGLEIVLSSHISAIVELGVERVINPGMNYVETMFVPAVGAAGRL